MLDIFRQKSGSWIIKITFVVIILSFIFFFGYSRLQRGGGSTTSAAYVNGEEIHIGLYKLAFQNTREFYKNLFKENIPEGMVDQIRSSALFQVIGQVLLTQFGKELGIVVTDEELFDAISNDPSFQTEGVFNARGYKDTFLPYFEKKYGLRFEPMLRNEILANKVRNFIMSSVNLSEPEVKARFFEERTSWKFDRVKVPESAAKDVEYDKSVEDIAKELNEVITKDYKKNALVKKYKLEAETIDDVSIAKKHVLLPSGAEETVYVELFNLSKENPTMKVPVKVSGAHYVFKLVSIKTPTEKEWETEKEQYTKDILKKARQEYLFSIQEYLKNKSTIEEFVINAQ